jgi:hypothetical protein
MLISEEMQYFYYFILLKLLSVVLSFKQQKFAIGVKGPRMGAYPQPVGSLPPKLGQCPILTLSTK